MFKYNLKTAVRSIFKNNIYSLFNLVGFSAGFSACLLSGLYIYREYNVDKVYPGCENIFRLVENIDNEAETDYDIVDKLKSDYPEIVSVVPVLLSDYKGFLKKTDAEDFIDIRYVIGTTNDFFKTFSVQSVSGNPDAPFSEGKTAVLSKSTAMKLFGRVDVTGETVSQDNWFELPVSGVVEDLPENSSMTSDIWLNSDVKELRLGTRCKDCSGDDPYYNPTNIYVQLMPGTDVVKFTDKLNSAFPANKSLTKTVRLQPLTDIYLDKTVKDNRNIAGSPALILIFSGIAFLILILSVINYANFALSKQLGTLKQLGIRTVNGASMKQTVTYFFIEISIFMSISLLFALFLANAFIDLFENILNVPLHFSYMKSPTYIAGVLAVLSLIIIVSSSAPMYVISKFDIQMLFGKKRSMLNKQSGAKILTGVQMVIAMVPIMCLLVIQKQSDYVRNYDSGFDKEHTVRLKIPYNSPNPEALKQKIDRYDFVRSSTLSNGVPGDINVYMTMKKEDEPEKYVGFNTIRADKDFIKTFDIKLLQGDEFSDDDADKACYINGEAMKEMGWNDFKDKTLFYKNYRIAGVVNDFNTSSLHEKILPVCINFFSYRPEYGGFTSLSVRVKGSAKEAIEKFNAAWKETMPNQPFRYSFYDDAFDAFYKKEERLSKAIALFSIIAMIITCMGLLGQTIQTCIARAKETGIRKVNGAAIKDILFLLIGDFMIRFSVAFVISVPVAWYSMSKWLQNFAYRTDLNLRIFAIAGLIVASFVMLTVGFKACKTAAANPSEVLKSE